MARSVCPISTRFFLTDLREGTSVPIDTRRLIFQMAHAATCLSPHSNLSRRIIYSRSTVHKYFPKVADGNGVEERRSHRSSTTCFPYLRCPKVLPSTWRTITGEVDCIAGFLARCTCEPGICVSTSPPLLTLCISRPENLLATYLPHNLASQQSA